MRSDDVYLKPILKETYRRDVVGDVSTLPRRYLSRSCVIVLFKRDSLREKLKENLIKGSCFVPS